LARLFLTRPRIFAIGLATATLAFVACGHHNTTPTVTPTVTPTSIVSAGPTSSPCILSVGVAFEPDAGNGNGFDGLQITHYEGNDTNTCSVVGPTAAPATVPFASSVNGFVIGGVGPDGNVDSVAVLENSLGNYSLVQDVFGADSALIAPVGLPYDASVQPTAAATSGAAASATTVPVIPNITSVTMLGGGSTGLALIVGPAASPPAIVAVTSLENAPPVYGLSVGYNQSTYTFTSAPNVPRSILAVDGATTSVGTAAFARGTADLLLFEITSVSVSGYQFNAEADDSKLGTDVALTGAGNIGWDPADGTRALIGGTTGGNQSELTLVTGLPTAITETAQLTLPGNITSISIAPQGDYAAVGTTAGIVIVGGVNGSVLTIQTPFSVSPLSSSASAITYTNCNGTSSRLTNIYSVRFGSYAGGSTVNQFLVALGSAPGVTCGSGHNATLAALPFDPATGTTPAPTAAPTASPVPSPTAVGATPTPVPTPTPPPVFVQNNMIAPPTGADLLVVK
jgi:hypothetical protein